MNSKEEKQMLDKSFYSGVNIDVVFCIDVAMSMESHLDRIKQQAINIYFDLKRDMEGRAYDDRNKIESFRIKLITYNDFMTDAKDGIYTTEFFEMKDSGHEFFKELMAIKAVGGGDVVRHGLEALNNAIRSDWNNSKWKKRQIIFMWSDAPAPYMGYGSSSDCFPNDVSNKLGELSEMWEEHIKEQGCRALMIFAPDESGWSAIYDNWSNIIFYPSKAGENLSEYDYNSIISIIGELSEL